jgi:hypothetical protein
MTKRLLTVAITVTLAQVFLTGCEDTNFEAITPAPPTRVAELDDESNRITISKGVALAFECNYGFDNAGDRNCGEGTISSNDPSIAAAYLGYSEELFEIVWYREDPQGEPPTRFVVIGFEAGDTTLDVHTDCGDEQFRVTVLDDE